MMLEPESAQVDDNFSRNIMDIRRHLKQSHAIATCDHTYQLSLINRDSPDFGTISRSPDRI